MTLYVHLCMFLCCPKFSTIMHIARDKKELNVRGGDPIINIIYSSYYYEQFFVLFRPVVCVRLFTGPKSYVLNHAYQDMSFSAHVCPEIGQNFC